MTTLSRLSGAASKMMSAVSRRPLREDGAFISNVAVLIIGCLTVAVLDAAASRTVSFRVGSDVFANLNILIAGILVPIASFYTYVRFDKAVASIGWALAAVCLLIPTLCLLTYVACAYGSAFPLRDDALAAFDATLGFSWPSMMAWADGHPLWSEIGRLAYLSVFPQAALAILVLSLTRQAERLQAMIYAFAIGAVLCSVASSVVPALGAYRHFGIEPGSHAHTALQVRDLTVSTVLELRSGSFAEFSSTTSQGIISFPSFHTVLGLLMAWAFWNVTGLRWGGLVLNAVLIAATPLQGSHYLADVLAGAAIGWAAIRAGIALHAAAAALPLALAPPRWREFVRIDQSSLDLPSID